MESVLVNQLTIQLEEATRVLKTMAELHGGVYGRAAELLAEQAKPLINEGYAYVADHPAFGEEISEYKEWAAARLRPFTTNPATRTNSRSITSGEKQ